MKTLKLFNKASQIIMAACALASLVLFFFTSFAVVTAGGKEVALSAAMMSFKGSIKAANGAKLAVSADVWFCFWLTVLALVFSVVTFFKGKFARYAAPALGLGTGIYMLVIACSKPYLFVDIRPLNTVLGSISSIKYGYAVWAIMAALFATFVFGVVHLIVNDYIEVAGSKGGKLTVPKRIVRFFKDYKSELKKVVWPNWKQVAKNTLIVLVMCVIVGVVIWVLDFGLAKLLDLLFK